MLVRYRAPSYVSVHTFIYIRTHLHACLTEVSFSALHTVEFDVEHVDLLQN